METTRHFTATVYLVHDGATALHEHPSLGIRIPPGGHVDHDEVPHEAGLREAREETGLDPTLVDDTRDIEAPAGMTLPSPRHTMLYDINVHDDGTVGHQHIDHVYFAAVDDRAIDPDGDDEVGPEAWAWYTPKDLRESDVDSDTTEIGIEAIETVRAATER
ncbi:NUDIX domain-containing protein [Halobaculum sp. WSA2]|uniref:NUDIX domain-containing protein n=1 Tax=Halobaculum saliterrae TaxID=2073113 RepID=A0A6B0SR72_9EURY|nr:NUDIX domain-containing protein [Halobaculum saliterrae]MXR41438.1 NUDIX domain-containing protein [Halobaculum saliterrae]